MSLELNSKYVKTGAWTNVDGGPVLGRTITTDTQTGNLVVAMLAVLSTLGTAHLWHLIAFAIHQIRANGRPADAMFRQQQALLRTLPTPSSVVAEALKLWWAWRKNTNRPFLRSMVLVLVAMLFTAVTVAASVFSSFVVDSGSIEVLVDSPLCGRINGTGTAWRTYITTLIANAPVYAGACYRNGSLPALCNDAFTNVNIPLTVGSTPCPFNETMCGTKNAVTVDSGLVDVGKMFGLNLAAKDRVMFRKKVSCTVLPSEGSYEVFDLELIPSLVPADRFIFPGEQILALLYGPTDQTRIESYIGYLLVSNITGNPTIPLGSVWYRSPVNRVPQGWFPLESFFPLQMNDGPDGDLILKPFMQNRLMFATPTDDPLYSSHKNISSWDLGQEVTNYASDDPVKGVACTQHFQYCHARDGQDDYCTPFEGLPYHEMNKTHFPDSSSMQQAVLQLLIMSSWLHTTARVQTNQASDLEGRSTYMIPSMPDDFWKREVLGWEQEVWAAMQMAVSQYAIGPKASDPFADAYVIAPQTEGEKALCGAQKMKKSGGFVNINVFGLSFVIAFSILVAIVDITLLKFLVYLTRFRRALGPRIARWTQDGVWQLQRRAYEGEGHRNWTNLESEIPLMEKGHKLKDLPIMWRPGKSPMVKQPSSFASTDSMVSQQSSISELAAEDVVDSAPVVTEQRRSWFSFVRR
ncbi:hypothetical protein AG0111_0g5246 [Alternaria gaisen]|uniref:Uncharacterized protein n=1 Tax=Alternaria gaisen TaxID=167740 RepID=A0ACB6FRL1_9PLEO|nr:hypothetical protein AG0111_0g5246 [Alternaria gaisen]